MRGVGLLQLRRASSSTVKYPPILDLSPAAVKKRERGRKTEKFQALKSVEEKLFAINLDKYYGWNSYILKEGSYPYDFLPFAQHVTRTRFVPSSPEVFKGLVKSDGEVEALVDRIRPFLQEAILFELNRPREQSEKSDAERQDEMTRSLVERINDIFLSSLSTQYPHLVETMVDYDPRVEAFWYVGNFHPSEEEYAKREKNKELTNEQREEMVEHWIQYMGRPCIQLRSPLPLNLLNTTDLPPDEGPSSIPETNSDPGISYGLQMGRRHGTNLPGFWPGDKCESGILSVHLCGHLLDRPPHFGGDEKKRTLDAQAILASFGWLHAQANYHGFSTFSDLTYPLVTQTVITDGRNFSFYLYQMNTTLLHSDQTKVNPRSNLCVGLDSIPLYAEIQGNEFKGWNDQVLTTLLSMYLNKPEERSEVQWKPYVDPEESLVREIDDVERRVWLHNQFRHMYSNRHRHRLGYEIYDWERIYKIEFQTKPMDARHRPFERDENPLEERKYWDYSPPYIPKKFRPQKKHWMGVKANLAKTYFPDV